EAFLSVSEGLPALVAELPNPVPVGAIGSSTELPGGITIEVEDGELDPSSPWEAVLSLGSPDNGIDIRTVSLDDTISLPGGGKKKAGDCLREGRVPAPVRRDVLGIYVNGKLQWIPGLRQSNDSIFSHDTEGHHIGIIITRDGMPL
ncbi:MAG: hypothetical protein JJU11_03430, partial [Candidatus Sumerlaeia bacterium]|nr:hypothetical protein [Candidatus Sumerlaeia bacterium]